MSTDDNIVVSAVTVGTMIGVSPKTLANWRCQGKGPPFLKIGRLIRYRKSAILEWLSIHELSSTSASLPQSIVKGGR